MSNCPEPNRSKPTMGRTATLTAEIAATAARLVVEDGLEYGLAKRRAAELLGKRGLPAGWVSAQKRAR